MKKIYLLITIFFLAACDVSKDSNIDPIENSSNNNSAESISSNTNSVSEQSSEKWNQTIEAEMMTVLGETIPYIKEFGNNYLYKVDLIAGSGTPYINPYIKGASNWISQYKIKVLSSGYIFVNEDIDDDGITVWYNYAKTIKQGSTLELRFSFYASEGTNWFDIYASLDNGGGGGMEIPDEADYQLLPTDFGAYATNVVLNKNGIGYIHTDVMNYKNEIQIKKTTGIISNTTPIAPMYSLYLEDINDWTNVIVSAGTDKNNLKAITTYNGVYSLNGATYFQIKSASRNVATLYSIMIVLK